MNIRQRQPRQKDERRLAWLRTQPCVICGAINTEAAHIRVGSIGHGKRDTGMAEKPSDKWTVSLCNWHHRRQHSMAELDFWREVGMDPFMTAIRQQPEKS
jgi:hypothetical protein